MAWELVKEVLHHAPPMTASERLVLLAIAEETRKPGQSWDIGTNDMKRMTGGLAGNTVRDAVARLAARGIDVRVQLKGSDGRPRFDKKGQPIYAVPGTTPSYRLPRFPPPPDCDCKPCKDSRSGEASADRPLDDEAQVKQGAGKASPPQGAGKPESGAGKAASGAGVPGAAAGRPAPMPFHEGDVVPPHAMPDDAAAMLRTASPPGENQTNPATAGDGPTLSDATRDTIAAARAMIGVNKKPTSRWTPYKATGTQPPDALRNPHYDPNAAAKALELLAELPDMPLSEPESATARLVEADR